jgi:hypothetical protein
MRILYGVVILLLVVGGCKRSDELQRVPVTGKVTFQGQPLTNGQIRFIPASGPVSGADIRDGAYSANQRGGVPVGPCRVEIEARRPMAGAQPDPVMGGKAREEQYLPAKYNTQSELTITIEPGSGPITKDYSLE